MTKHVICRSLRATGCREFHKWCANVDSKHLLRTPFIGQIANYIWRRAIARSWYRASLPRDSAAGAVIAREADVALRNGALFPLASMMQNLFPSMLQVPRVQRPTLLLWGGADRSHRRTDHRSSTTLVDAAHLVGYEVHDHVGHFFPEEDPELFISLLRKYKFL